MKHITYNTSGTCAKVIELDLDDNNVIHNCKFLGGCNGNLKAISKLGVSDHGNDFSDGVTLTNNVLKNIERDKFTVDNKILHLFQFSISYININECKDS